MHLSRYSRAEARFLRQHTGDPPQPSAPLTPIWHDLAAGACLAIFITVIAVLT